MNSFFSHALSGMLMAAVCGASVPAQADSSTAVHHKSGKKKSHAKVAKAAPAEFELAVPEESDTGAPIDPKKALSVEYKCELGANITIFRNEGDDKTIALQFQKILTRMQRVGTTTGANRFENKRSGLVWIGIPAKGILLNAKQGHQLANECKVADQRGTPPLVAIAPKAVPEETGKTAAPVVPAGAALGAGNPK